MNKLKGFKNMGIGDCVLFIRKGYKEVRWVGKIKSKEEDKVNMECYPIWATAQVKVRKEISFLFEGWDFLSNEKWLWDVYPITGHKYIRLAILSGLS